MKIQRANTVAASHVSSRPMPAGPGGGFPSPFMGGRMLPATPGGAPIGGAQAQHPAYGGNASPSMAPRFSVAGPSYDHENPRAPREAGARYYDPDPNAPPPMGIGAGRHGMANIGAGAAASMARHHDDADDMYDDPFMDYQQQIQQQAAAAARERGGYVPPRFM